MFTLMLTVGLRQRELLALKWSDLDEQTGVLTISEGRCVVKGKLTDYGGNTRQITLTPEMVALLRQEHNRHPSSEAMFVHPGTRKPYAPTMANEKSVFIQVMEKPTRKVVIKRGIAAADYFAYCEEVGCDVWGVLTSMYWRAQRWQTAIAAASSER